MKAIIIDDEPNSVAMLSLQLNQLCPDIDIVAKCLSSPDALKAIQDLGPDVIFLDIEMPIMNGFQLLEQLEEINFGVIFVTAYNDFAIRAFRFSAVDYLVKPVANVELIDAVKKAGDRMKPNHMQLSYLQKLIHNNEVPQKLAVSHQGSIVFVDVHDIIYGEADSNYTTLSTTSGQRYILSRTLREVQAFLEHRNFVRVHRQFLVNLDHIKMLKRGEGNYLIMSDNKSIPVARNQKEKLLQRFGWL